MLQRLIRAALVLALACSIGLHWAFFQSLAWVGMIVTYSHQTTLTRAVAKTFDGRHPCTLCKQIAKEKQSEKKSDLRPEWSKFEFSFVPAEFVFVAPADFYTVATPETLVRFVVRTPPVPPPRTNRG